LDIAVRVEDATTPDIYRRTSGFVEREHPERSKRAGAVDCYRARSDIVRHESPDPCEERRGRIFDSHRDSIGLRKRDRYGLVSDALLEPIELRNRFGLNASIRLVARQESGACDGCGIGRILLVTLLEHHEARVEGEGSDAHDHYECHRKYNEDLSSFGSAVSC
jgi:hypothetical protein